LEKAKQNCDYLIVGVHEDAIVNKEKGDNHPLSNLHERVLGVLSCRYVDEVIIGAPYVIDSALIKGQNISVVFSGTERDVEGHIGKVDPYQYAKEAGIHCILESPSKVTTSSIIDKIIDNSAAFRERNRKKQAKERKEAAAAQ